MVRPLFTETVLFLAPFAAYVLYLWVTRVGIMTRTSWSTQTVASLTIVALLLMVASFVLIAEFAGTPPGSTYVPARVEGGRLVPGGEK
jgi:hypothetical protein